MLSWELKRKVAYGMRTCNMIEGLCANDICLGEKRKYQSNIITITAKELPLGELNATSRRCWQSHGEVPSCHIPK